jgi:hypothetical protein
MGDHPERLLELLGGDRTAAVIANALDEASPATREEGVQRELDALGELGLEAGELDLRDYFDSSERIAADLRAHGLVWLRGGDVFVLRYALAASGAPPSPSCSATTLWSTRDIAPGLAASVRACAASSSSTTLRRSERLTAPSRSGTVSGSLIT